MVLQTLLVDSPCCDNPFSNNLYQWYGLKVRCILIQFSYASIETRCLMGKEQMKRNVFQSLLYALPYLRKFLSFQCCEERTSSNTAKHIVFHQIRLNRWPRTIVQLGISLSKLIFINKYHIHEFNIINQIL